MYTTIVLNVDELWLKGKNRPHYFSAMKKHLKFLFKNLHEAPVTIKNEQQRLVARSEVAFGEEIIDALKKVPGLSSFSPVVSVALEQEAILPAVEKELKKMGLDKKTFKVQSKRINKRFSTPSMELNRFVAGHVLRNFEHFKVDVHKPDFYIDIKVMPNSIYISTQTIKCPGGLPVGTSGRLVTMISGGFDSPVASYMMSKRGASQDFIFFYAYPYVGEEVKEKILDMCKVLSCFQNGCRLYVVPFGEVQNHISKVCREEYRTLLFRKYMIDIANLLADRNGAQAILTGDALGQVSSQTIDNMSALDKSSDRLIMRPLVGFNKLEIIETAKKIGTHDISIIPHDDACSLFAPKHPIIRPQLKYWDAFLAENDVNELLTKALDDAEVYKFNNVGEIKFHNVE